MSKLFHLVYILIWSHAMLYFVDKIHYQLDFGILHLFGLIIASMAAGFQFYDITNEIVNGD